MKSRSRRKLINLIKKEHWIINFHFPQSLYADTDTIVGECQLQKNWTGRRGLNETDKTPG